MKIKNKIFSLLVLLTLLFTLTMAFTSCTAGSEVIYSKEELYENVTSETNTSRGYVWEYLDSWKFPEFNQGKLKKVEKLYRDHYYKEIPSSYELAKTVAEDFLENSYDKIELDSSQKVSDALLNAFVKAIGDKYSFYRTNEQYEDYTSGMSGNFVGIGVNVQASQVGDGILVIKPLRNSPAEKAGVLAGDLIIAVDGVLVNDVGYADSIASVKGESGTEVTITVRRGEDTLDITVTRGPVVELTVDYILDEDKIGYIDINSFKKNTDELFAEAIDYMKENGAKAIIYDVRGNGGGYLETVVNMLDYIAEDGINLVSFSNDYGPAEKSRDGHSYAIPSVILCNGSSASASELFTSGMRDLSEMGYFPLTVVGQTTYGKFVMQNSYTLSDGSAVTLTVSYYYSPSGKEFNEVGITPDVIVKGDNAQLESAYTEAAKLLENK